MAIIFRHSAGKHGIGRDRARYVIEHCPNPLYADIGDIEVIHAMVMRRKFADAYREVMRWR